MNRDLILSLDVGTLGAKVGIFNSNLELVAQNAQEYSISHPKATWAEQRPEVWWETLKALINNLLNEKRISPERIGVIGISNTCPSLIAMDEEGDALRPSILFMDQRSIKQAQFINKKVGRRDIFEITGNRIASGTFSLTSMLWIKDNEPHIYKNTKSFVHANGYIVNKLTKERAMDPSNASLTGLFDIRKIKWSEEIAQRLDFDLSKLPKIIWSYEKVGLTKELDKELNLPEGIPVVIGAADSACAALGLGTVNDGEAFETTGTSSVLAVVSNKPLFDSRLINRCHVKENLWLLMGAMSTTGASLRWFKDNFFSYEVFLAKELKVSPYEIIDEEAKKSPIGSNNLIFLPYMMGERCPLWDPYARGVLIGLSLAHKKGDIARAIMEGVAYGLRSNLEVIESLGLKVNEIRVTGAGARSHLWKEIKSNVLRKRIVSFMIKEAALLGAAILASCNSSSEIVNRANKIYQKREEVIEPTYSEPYNFYYEIFKDSYKKLKSIFKRLQREVMV
ncbi:MAG: FGGY family carbohydrate kinase [Nitrososphaerales archaeon]